MHHNRSILLILIILALSCCIQNVIAVPPIPEGRPGYLLPLHSPYANQSFEKVCKNGECFSVNDVYPTNLSFRSPPFFLNMSNYHAFMNISSDGEDQYVSEVWYFNNWDEFQKQRERLFTYLVQHGTVSSTTVDLSDALNRTNNTYYKGLTNKRVSAIQYINATTSGYFIIFDTHFFPGPNYYIAYYGVVGSSDLKNHSSQLDSFMIIVPYFMEGGGTNTMNPESPMATPTIPVLATIPVGAVAIVIMIRKNRGNT